MTITKFKGKNIIQGTSLVFIDILVLMQIINILEFKKNNLLF